MHMGTLKVIQGDIQGVYIIYSPPLRYENNSTDEFVLLIPNVIIF